MAFLSSQSFVDQLCNEYLNMFLMGMNQIGLLLLREETDGSCGLRLALCLKCQSTLLARTRKWASAVLARHALDSGPLRQPRKGGSSSA
jgi:hypothetical protein